MRMDRSISAFNFVATVVIIACVLLFVGTVAASTLGVSSARGESQYTGVVVDVEEDKGLVFRTSQAHVRTDERASQTETFCVHPDSKEEQIPDLRSALNDQTRVTITYERPRVVPIWTCESGTSIITNIEVHNGGVEA